ncbi:DUF5681 domain-containing protein [Mesorhizobium sp. ASY16-5R]|uniref:DUF5681 domain-containing protein n=1 Tax=Mesorhizobium sp. ASY16-5R TaxID=3445772 RepID=UPI003F9F70E3
MSKNSGGAAAKRPDGRPVGTPFKSGTSGNPKGRRKGLRNSKTILRELLEIVESVAHPITGETYEADQLEQIWAEQVKRARTAKATASTAF